VTKIAFDSHDRELARVGMRGAADQDQGVAHVAQQHARLRALRSLCGQSCLQGVEVRAQGERQFAGTVGSGGLSRGIGL